jgi:hypothetical protein
MASRITKDGDVEIDFWIVKSKDGVVAIWTDEPPPLPDVSRHGPYVATAQVVRRLAPTP